MALTDQIKKQLLKIKEENPERAYTNLKVGDELSRNLYRGSFIYQIDNLDTFRELGCFLDDNSFYLALFNQFKSFSEADYVRIFPPSGRDADRKIIVPFSRAVQARAGECLEKSLLVQLAMQRETSCFVVYGLLGHDRLPQNFPHVYKHSIKK